MRGVAIAVLLVVLGCQRTPDYSPPLWTTPGQRVRELSTGDIGTIRGPYGECEIVIDFEGRTIVCEPIKVVPIK